MPSCNTYHLTWVSLTLEVGYLFMAAPAKHSLCSIHWMMGISSQTPFLTLNVELFLLALLHPRSRRSLDTGLLLSATTPDLGLVVAHLSHGLWPQALGSSSWPLPLTSNMGCQEAFNRRLPMCCFGSVKNPLVLINSRIKRRGTLFLALRNPGISFVSFCIQWKVTIYDPLFI